MSELVSFLQPLAYIGLGIIALLVVVAKVLCNPFE